MSDEELAQMICDIDKYFYFKCDELGISFGLIRQTEDEFLNEVFKDFEKKVSNI